MRRQHTAAKNRPILQRIQKFSITCILLATISTYLLFVIPKCHELTKLDQDSLSGPLASFTSVDQGQKNRENYDVALLKLRCFTSPGCFPSVKCRHGQPQKIKRIKKSEEQSFCSDDLRVEVQGGGKCLVYSFGVFDSLEWEENIADMFGCEVHSFDPTVNLPPNPVPGVTFHRLGLQGVDTDMSATHSERYSPVDQSRLLPLEDIKIKLGHHNRSIDVLNLDCEGCEWGVIHQLACKGSETHMIKQIITEFHFQKNLGMHNEKHVMIAAEAVSCLEKNRWAMTSIESAGASFSDSSYLKGVSSVVYSKSFLLLASLRRIPEHEKLPYELIEDEANAARNEELKMFDYARKYGMDRTRWPNDFAELNQKRKDAVSNRRRVVKSRKHFDDNKYVEEKHT